MKKKNQARSFMAAIVALMFLAGGVSADTAKISKITNPSGVSRAQNGGPWYMDIYDVDGNSKYEDILVFCLEVNEYFRYSDTYEVASMTNAAEDGGAGGATNGKDPISEATAWIYMQTRSGGDYADTAYWDEVQWAVWVLENEKVLSDVPGDASNSNSSRAIVEEMIQAANDAGWSENEDYAGSAVVVYNLTSDNGKNKHQSQLGWNNETGGGEPVPEPAVLFLLGGGLLGLAGMRRRRRGA